jgi:hypothetical protein
MPLTSNQKLLERCDNVLDSPAQYAVLRLIVDSEDPRVGYAYPSRNKMARLLGRDRRYVLRVIEELELKEAIQRLGVDPRRGPRNRYVVTLERAIAKARAEAGVDDEVPLWKLPPRHVVRKSRITGGGAGTPPGETVFRSHPVQKWAGEGSADPRGEGSADPRGGGAGTPPDLLCDLPCDLHDVAAPADAGAATSSPIDQPIPGLLHADRTAALRADTKAAGDRRRSRLYHRVAAKARDVLSADVTTQAALNNGAPMATYEDFVTATKTLCALKRVKGYGEVVHKACLSEWWKRHDGRAVVAGAAPRPRDWRRR